MVITVATRFSSFLYLSIPTIEPKLTTFSPPSLPPPSSETPYLHHFRRPFPSCREIYLNISSLHTNHSLHYESFPPRTILPCYDEDFLRERARELLGWFRVCQGDEELHKILSVELMKVADESCTSFPSLDSLSVVSLFEREWRRRGESERRERRKRSGEKGGLKNSRLEVRFRSFLFFLGEFNLSSFQQPKVEENIFRLFVNN